MTELLVEASGLHTYYGSHHILQGVGFTIGRGEAIGLMGRNGMGKTTLLRTILGLVRPREGTIKIKGREATREAPHRIARSGLAYVPEGRGIFPNLTVRENLVMAARPGPWTLQRVLETFPRLAERLQHGGGQLSGGEQQMLTIGRALLTNPELLILDEATEGLAPRIAREIWAIVKSVRESGVATVIVDKNFKAVNAITDRNIILVKGRVAYEGPAADLAARPDVRQAHLGI
ncbi:MAG TPA: ABC transporter ATP-binding protein [Burkholderiales bacterium]|nr:ABC transporter ATP-binding protein [Burkholderiales bacterium]